jgi:hypothetical protein
MARRSRFALLAASCALVLAGAAAAADVWPKRQLNAADQAFAKRSVLHQSDFVPGSGWTSASTNGSSGSAGEPAACRGSSFSDQGRVITGKAESSFKAPGFQVWSWAEVMQTVDMVRRDVRAASDAALMKCMRASFEQELPQGSQLVSVRKLAWPAVGDWRVAFRALVDVAVQGTTVRLQVDMVLVQNKRAEITLMQLAPAAISAMAKAGEQRLVQRLAGSSLTA